MSRVAAGHNFGTSLSNLLVGKSVHDEQSVSEKYEMPL